MTSSESTDNVPICVSCTSLKSQNEFKDILLFKYHKISQAQDELIQAQRNLIKDLLKNRCTTNFDFSYATPMIGELDYYNEINYVKSMSNDIQKKTTPQASGSNDWCRIYIGAVTDDIDEGTLQQCLERAFGQVSWLEIVRARGLSILKEIEIPSQNCAFADFWYAESFHRALEQGYIYLNNGSRAKIKMATKPVKRFNGCK
ncbi:23039_t:CDS:2 [Dentiscutata erythropus]|uniref:23039_t:CDS:1 n=1 Tax=Dentiscutata erythropus TaxID=1348616 RepID=A0A9N9JDD4_9GLOM|nr:23039_t:CDS:2 [Dentiscutata erythropus]